MMENLPVHIHLTFIVITFATFGMIFYFLKIKRGAFNWKIGTIITFWLCLQTFLSLIGFYDKLDLFPPRFLFVIMPALIFSTLRVIKGKGLPAATYIGYIHLIRIPVEMVLYWLAQEKVIPDVMTFRGRNFDILAGVILPLATYLYFERGMISKKILIGVNFYGVFSLINIIGHGILSVPTPLQQFGFDQPNIVTFQFPFIWLPAFVVPAIFFAHLVTLKELFKKK